MTQTEKKKRNQITILIVLSAVLLAVIYWQYLLYPMITSCDELTESIQDNNTELAEIQSKIASIPGYERDISTTLDNLSEMTADLYPVMNTEDADIMLLSRLKSSGISAETLNITYEEISDENGGEPTGISRITAEYSAKGSYAQLIRFISSMNGMPAVVINSVTGTASETNDKSFSVSTNGAETNTITTPASENDMEFQLNISVYMYQSPEIPEHFSAPVSSEAEPDSSDSELDSLLEQ